MPDVALFPGTQKKNWRRAPGIHCSCMSGSPGFSEELGNYCDTSLSCMIVYYWIMGVVTWTCSPVCSTKPRRVPSVRLENQEWPEERTTDGNTARLQWQGCVCMVTDGHGKYTVPVLTICILPSHPLWMAYHYQ